MNEIVKTVILATVFAVVFQPVQLGAMKRVFRKDAFICYPRVRVVSNLQLFPILHDNSIDEAQKVQELKLALKSPDADINAQTGAGFTLLHVAFEYKSINIAKLLIAYGADITIKDTWKMTPLMRAGTLPSSVITYFTDFNAVAEGKLKKTEFIKKYLSTQELIDENLICTIRLSLARGSYQIFKKLCKTYKQDVAKHATEIVDLKIDANGIGTNRWYLQLLHLSAHSNNAPFCKGIIADQPELWDAIRFGKKPQGFADDEWEKSLQALKKLWASASKKKFRKPMAQYLKTRKVLGGTVWKTTQDKTIDIPQEIGNTIFQFVDPEAFGG